MLYIKHSEEWSWLLLKREQRFYPIAERRSSLNFVFLSQRRSVPITWSLASLNQCSFRRISFDHLIAIKKKWHALRRSQLYFIEWNVFIQRSICFSTLALLPTEMYRRKPNPLTCIPYNYVPDDLPYFKAIVNLMSAIKIKVSNNMEASGSRVMSNKNTKGKKLHQSFYQAPYWYLQKNKDGNTNLNFLEQGKHPRQKKNMALLQPHKLRRRTYCRLQQ